MSIVERFLSITTVLYTNVLTDGPYYLMTAEKTERGRSIYWSMEDERKRSGVIAHYITPTTVKEQAATFYIRPDYRCEGVRVCGCGSSTRLYPLQEDGEIFLHNNI